jgi:hypothetical protein
MRLVTHIVEITAQPSSLPLIIEFRSPDFHGFGALILPLLLALVATLGWSSERPDPFALVVVVAHVGLALYMQRNAPFLAIVAAPMLARAATAAFGGGQARPARALRLMQIVLVLGIIALAARTAPRHARFEASVDADYFPTGAVAFLQAQPPLGRMLNTFNWGGYLIYTLHPRYRVSIDGRGGAYGDAFIRDYLQLQLGGEKWRERLDRLAPDFVLCERGGRLAVLLAGTPGWAQVYRDRVAVIFVRADHPLRPQLERSRGERG